MHAPVLDAFPRRPIALARPGRRSLWLIAGLLLLLVPAYVGYAAWQRVSLRTDLRERGVSAIVLGADGSCTSRRGVALGCTYTIDYRTQDDGGPVRQGTVYVPGSGPRVFAPPARYDPQDPSRIMSDADLERGEPLMNVVMPVGIFGLLAILSLLVWYAMGNKALLRAAAVPRPVLVPVSRSAVRPNTKFVDVWFEQADGTEGRQPLFDGWPLQVTPPPGWPSAGQPALGLLGPKDRPILLTHDLRELDLTPEERAAILAAAQQG